IPSKPCSVVSSTKSITVSVSGFWRPVRTLASLTGLGSGSTTCDSFTVRIRSPVVAVAAGGVRVCVMGGVPRVVANLYDECATHYTSTSSPEEAVVSADGRHQLPTRQEGVDVVEHESRHRLPRLHGRAADVRQQHDVVAS